MIFLCEWGLCGRILAGKPESCRITCQAGGVICNPVKEVK